MSKEERMVPAIPPDDFGGSVADWMVQLQIRGHWNGHGWHGDVQITEEEWWDILEHCENGGEEEEDLDDEEFDVDDEEWDDMDDNPDDET